MVGRPPHSAEDAARTTRTTGHGRGLQGPEGRHVPGAKGTVLSSACKRCWASSRGLQLALEYVGQGPVRQVGGLQDHVCHGFPGQAQRQGLSHCGPGERQQQHSGRHRRGPQDPEATAGGCIQK